MDHIILATGDAAEMFVPVLGILAHELGIH
jgi:hypothetical protein